MRRLCAIACSLLLLASGYLLAQPTPAAQPAPKPQAAKQARPPEDPALAVYQRLTYKDEAGNKLDYRILFPENYDKTKKYPVILLLHGAGERGTDNEQQLKYGATMLIKPENRQKYPCIAIFPQCPPSRAWTNIEILNQILAGHQDQVDFHQTNEPPMIEETLAMAILKKVLKEEAADPNRVYLMGLSMGGMGTFEMLARWPDMWAAAVPICGGGLPSSTRNYANKVPVWITHGEKDGTVLPRWSKAMYEALKSQGSDVKLTIFPGVGHGAWNPTFDLPDFLPWVFSHVRGQRQPTTEPAK